ncbi:hypothetical protein CK203_018004 [Vitis vinifera]|uniref:DUF4283 domain-containing protein n=1 Tax=Vitis vinifera TaxID=29760 RepID=A0A438JWL4_VITVI|nr:hypothetical protein CK203_018004 [Vitis vinifera]
MLTMACRGFGGLPKGKSLWGIAILMEVMWDVIYLSSSLWASASASFVGAHLSIILLDWNMVSRSTRRKECKFSVESKEFEIIGDERKGKLQVLIVEKKGGVASWVRLGSDSLGLFLEGLNLCIMDEKETGWGREWKEQGRTFSMSRGINNAGEYIRLGVYDLGRKHFCIFVPRGRKEKRGWMTMADKIKEVIEDDLEKLGQRWAKSWELKGSLGLAKMEKGRVLLDFEDLEEARRVVSSGNRTMEGVQVGLDFWSPRSGCWTEEEKAKEIWVRLFGLPVSFWSPEILKKVGDECGGFITADEQTKLLGELQWARILVRGRGDARPSVLEVEVEEEVYEIALWWECRPVIRRSSRQADGRCRSEVRGDGTGGQRAVGGRVVSNEGRGPIFPSWTQFGAVHPLSPNVSPKVLKGDVGLGLKSGIMGLKMKGVALSPDAGPSCRPDEVGCSTIGPVSTSSKGLSSKGYGPQSVRSKTHAPEPFVAWETEDLRKLNGLVRISETDKALEEESMRYGNGLWSWGKGFWGFLISTLLILIGLREWSLSVILGIGMREFGLTIQCG